VHAHLTASWFRPPDEWDGPVDSHLVRRHHDQGHRNEHRSALGRATGRIRSAEGPHRTGSDGITGS